jgi:hypothetical protein
MSIGYDLSMDINLLATISGFIVTLITIGNVTWQLSGRLSTVEADGKSTKDILKSIEAKLDKLVEKQDKLADKQEALSGDFRELKGFLGGSNFKSFERPDKTAA